MQVFHAPTQRREQFKGIAAVVFINGFPSELTLGNESSHQAVDDGDVRVIQ
jgi:hypothetical protein